MMGHPPRLAVSAFREYVGRIDERNNVVLTKTKSPLSVDSKILYLGAKSRVGLIILIIFFGLSGTPRAAAVEVRRDCPGEDQ